MNNVQLVGRLTRDPELRQTSTGKTVAKFALACDRYGKTTFVDCEIWEKQAELIGQYCHKGDALGVTGSIRKDSYEKDGQKRYFTYVSCDSMEFLTPKGQGGNSQQDTEVYSTEDLPF